MSRIGKQPVKIPEDVEVKIAPDFISVKGPRGEISRRIHDLIGVEKKDGLILVIPKNDSKEARALWGTFRSLINSMVKGVKDGFEKVLVYEGIGYKSEVKSDSSAGAGPEGKPSASYGAGKVLVLSVGFTHPVIIKAPKGIDFKAEKNQITVSGVDKELVGQIAADIRKVRPPEPYKGKGIRYKDEIIIRKAGKKAVTAS